MKPIQHHDIKYRMEKKPEAYRLFLYDEISSVGEFNWDTWNFDESETSAKHIRDLLDGIPRESTIEVHLNSRGGEVSEGVTIYNLLRQKSQKDDCLVIGYVDGYAYSVAMTIAMACDEIHMGLGTSMLIHNPWGVVAGNADQLRVYADQLDALADSSRQLYMARAKDLTEAELKDMMDRETLMDPETCLKYGFCDIIDKYKKQEEPEDDPEEPDEADDTEDKTEKQLAGFETVEALKKQLKEQAFTREEVTKMLSGIKAEAKTEAPGEPIPEPEEDSPGIQIKPTIGDTLIAAMKAMSSHK